MKWIGKSIETTENKNKWTFLLNDQKKKRGFSNKGFLSQKISEFTQTF